MAISLSILVLAGIIVLVIGVILGWLAGKRLNQSSPADNRGLEQRIADAETNTRKAQEDARSAGEARAAMSATAEHLEKRVREVEAERDVAREAASKANDAVSQMRLEVEVEQAKIGKERQSLVEQTALLQKSREELTQSFTVAAQKLYQEQSAQFRTINKDQIISLLQPFREQIGELQKGVVEASKERLTLQNNIERIALEAHSLTNALRGDSKAQGDWGEMVIDTILENSGLVKDVSYYLQYPAKNEDGSNVFLDVLLRLPDERYMILDCKTSITEYDRFMNSESDDDRNQHLDGLVASLKAQIKGLAGKRYDRIKEVPTLEAVLMWVPNEGALTQAIKHDRTLVNFAHQNRIIPVSATTLFAIIKVVERLWQYEKQNRSVQHIVDRATKIYDKFIGFADAMDSLGKALDNASTSYQQAKNRLTEGRNNVVRQLEQMREYGGLATKGQLKGDWIDTDGTDDKDTPSLAGSE